MCVGTPACGLGIVTAAGGSSPVPRAVYLDIAAGPLFAAECTAGFSEHDTSRDRPDPSRNARWGNFTARYRGICRQQGEGHSFRRRASPHAGTSAVATGAAAWRYADG